MDAHWSLVKKAGGAGDGWTLSAEARGLLTDVPPSVGDGLAVVADWVGDLLPLERLDPRLRRSSE